MSIVPFRFLYAFDATFLTDKGNFKVTTSATSDALETFWTEKVTQVKSGEAVQVVNSLVTNVHIETMKSYGFPFKMTIKFGDNSIFLYCADIYDTESDKLKYSINDEMLLIFDSEDQAMIFERLIENG